MSSTAESTVDTPDGAPKATQSASTVGEARTAPRPRRRTSIVLVLVGVLVCVLAAAAYAVTLAPAHYAQAQAEQADGRAAVEVGGGVQVVPDRGWVVQPRVAHLVELPPLPPLRDWTVLTGAETGVELLSPDRGLSIELSAAAESDESDAAWLAEGGIAEGGAQRPTVLAETLASGASLSHVDAAGEIRAIVGAGDAKVRVLARTVPAHEEGTGATDPISVYRPALSALLESLEFR